MMQAWADYCTGKTAAAGKAKRPAGKKAKAPTAPAELAAQDALPRAVAPVPMPAKRKHPAAGTAGSGVQCGLALRLPPFPQSHRRPHLICQDR